MKTECNDVDRLVGQSLCDIRQSRSMTVQAVADALDMSPVIIERIESGKKRASANILFQLCNILNVKPSDIYIFTK